MKELFHIINASGEFSLRERIISFVFTATVICIALLANI